MYACKKKKSAVPDLPIVLGIVYCFGLSASTEPTSRLTVHILGAHVSHIPHPKRGRLDGAAGRRATLWLETNTHANRGGVQTCPSPLHHQEGALRQSLSLSFWFLNSGFSLHGPDCSGTHSIADQAGLTNLVSAS